MSVTHGAARWLVLSSLLLARDAYTAQAGQGGVPANGSTRPTAPAQSSDLPFAILGPPPPVPPEVVARDESGRTTIRAVRLAAPLRIDGKLDEGVYASVASISGLIQVEPEAGMPSTQNTDVWVFFDSDRVYVSARCWEDHPDRMVANEMRRDSFNIVQNEHIAFVFDTFYDRRNSVAFAVNPLGGRLDGQITNERQFNSDWNPIWDVAVGRFEGGWTMEAAIPFKSLRYRPGRAQIWGFNLQRYVRWKNELGALTRIPKEMAQGSPRAIFQTSLAATLVGLEVPGGSRNLEIKPYVISDLKSDVNASPRISNDLSGDVGLDVKYGVTQNVTADFTYNTDFAQVEADEQQVNLTRFSLFFPEKREFFLENQGTFAFGGVAPGTTANANATSDTPILFYSRRVGLNQGRVVPIQAGGRLTGRLGRFSFGVLNIQADDEPVSRSPVTNFSVARIRRDILRKSNVGVIFTSRSAAQGGVGTNEAYGVDGTFSFFESLAINTYWARTRTDGLAHEDTSYRAQLDYAGDRYGVQLERLVVGDHFNPEVGFLRRDDMRRSFGQFRFSPRPRSIKAVRKFSWTGSLAYIENGAGRLETRDGIGEFAVELQNSDRFSVAYEGDYEFLPQPFPIATGVRLPVGGYDFATMRTGFTFGQQRPVSGNLLVEYGTFYDGHKTTLSFSRGRVNLTSQLSIEPSVSLNWVDLAEGSFTTRLVSSRVTYTVTPLLFVSALLQYNSGTNAVVSNVRLRWEYRPGSELFVVLNEQRDALARSFPALANRALIVKVNRLFRL